MAKIQTIKNSENTIIYPQTHTQAVYDAKGKKLQEWMNEYLTTEDESAIEDVNTSFEIQGNKTTVLDSNSTNTQYPAAKTVYDFVTQNFQAIVDLSLKYTVVSLLPSEGEYATIYLVQNFDNMKEQNIYDEYLYINNKWELIGTTQIDLSNYYTKTETDNKYAKLDLYGDTAINLGRKANTTVGENSIAVGLNAEASKIGSCARGRNVTASAFFSHAEGGETIALKDFSHAEGYSTEAKGEASHAEGNDTIAWVNNSHTEGKTTQAYGENSHAEGELTQTYARASHSEGTGTRTNGRSQHVQGEYNIVNGNLGQYPNERDIYAHIVGNGTDYSNPSNAYTLDWNGNAWYQGDVYVGSTSGTNKDNGSKKLATEEYADNKITYGTTTLEDGVSELATGTLYVVYEE